MISKKNQKRFPDLKKGDVILVLNSSISVLNGARGEILEDNEKEASPYKKIYKVRLSGLPETGNPWYVFRSELYKITKSEG